jgi:hypothetical protein
LCFGLGSCSLNFDGRKYQQRVFMRIISSAYKKIGSVRSQALLEVGITIIVPVVAALIGACCIGIGIKCLDIVRSRKRKAEQNGEDWHLCPRLPSCRVAMPSIGWCGLDKLAGCFRRHPASEKARKGKSEKVEESCIAV